LFRDTYMPEVNLSLTGMELMLLRDLGTGYEQWFVELKVFSFQVDMFSASHFCAG
jgi:hypothetical protein